MELHLLRQEHLETPPSQPPFVCLLHTPGQKHWLPRVLISLQEVEIKKKKKKRKERDSGGEKEERSSQNTAQPKKHKKKKHKDSV